jgi:hypothetical protein
VALILLLSNKEKPGLFAGVRNLELDIPLILQFNPLISWIVKANSYQLISPKFE